MTSVEQKRRALARLTPKPKARRRPVRAVGGFVCPAEASHGPMFNLPDGRWYCAHHAHDGSRQDPPSRSLWPADLEGS